MPADLSAAPWYVVVGPEQAGKSLMASLGGLRPLVGGANHPLGVHAGLNTWIGDTAVVIDVPASFVAQPNTPGWQALTKMLAKSSREPAINSLIWVVPAVEFLASDTQAVTATATTLRACVDQLTAKLGITVPVHMVVSKCDALVGFLDMFWDLDDKARREAYGVVLRADKPSQGAPPVFLQKFDELSCDVEARMLRRMSEDNRIEGREKIYSFVQQFEWLRNNLYATTEILTKLSPEGDSPRLRGVYFTGMAPAPAPGADAHFFFLEGLLSDQIFPDECIAGTSPSRLRRLKRRRRIGGGLMIAAGLIVCVLVALTYASYRDFSERLEDAVAAITNDPASSGTSETISFDTIEAVQSSRRQLEKRNAAGEAWARALGVNRDDALSGPLDDMYYRLLKRRVIVPLFANEEGSLRRLVNEYANNETVPPAREYPAFRDRLRAYLRISGPTEPGEPPAADPTWAANYLASKWSNAGRDKSTLAKAMSDYLAAAAKDPRHRLVRDPRLVADVRRILGRVPSDQVWMATAVQDVKASPVTLASITGAKTVLNNGKIAVPGLYHRQTWEAQVRARLAKPPSGEAGIDWVVARELDAPPGPIQLRSSYFANYTEYWRTFVTATKVASPAERPQIHRMLQQLTGKNAAVRRLYDAVVWNTDLCGGDGSDALAQPLGAKAPPSGELVSCEQVASAFAGIKAMTGPAGPLEKALAQTQDVMDALKTRLGKYDDPGEMAFLARVSASREAVETLIRQARTSRWQQAVRAHVLSPLTTVSVSDSGRPQAAGGERWCREVVRPLWEVHSRYPFRPRSADLSLGTLENLFRPTSGLLWRYYSKVLKARTTRRGTEYKLRRDTKPKLTPKTTEFLHSIHELTNALFPKDSEHIKVELDVRIRDSIATSETLFTVDGKTFRHRNGDPKRWHRLVWPGDPEKSSGTQLLTRGFGLTGLRTNPGTWGLFRLIEKAKVTRNEDGSFSAEFDFRRQGAGTVVLDFRPVRPTSPFFGPNDVPNNFLETFRTKDLIAPVLVSGEPRCKKL